jgi:transposase InsO family protein
MLKGRETLDSPTEQVFPADLASRPRRHPVGCKHSIEGAGTRFLIHDRDAKFCGPFDEVLGSEGMRIIRTPIRSPQANAVAERCVKTLRHEVLDWTLILGRRHLDRVLASYVVHYNAQRPHRGIALRVPEKQSPVDPVAIVPEIKRRDLLGGLIHEYYPVAA